MKPEFQENFSSNHAGKNFLAVRKVLHFPALLQKALIIILLGLLTASAFFIRLENYKNSKLRSIDEIVYYRMAEQVLEDGPAGYHTMPYGKELAARGRPLPAYFNQPLFKHPPLFTFLVSASLKIFGKNSTAAFYVSLLFGVLLIPVTYFLGSVLYNWKIGICSAVFVWLDPVNVMTSQKIWMDTTIAFFMLTAFLLFVYGLKSEKGFYYILSGVVCGLAALTKYTGILTMFSIGLFAFIRRRDLFQHRSFLVLIILPLVMLLPWFYWNFLVFGSDFLITQKALHRNTQMYVTFAIFFFFAAILIGVVRILTYFLNKKKAVGTEHKGLLQGLTRQKINIALGIALGVVVIKSLGKGLQFDYLPRTSWAGSIFSIDPPTFYVAQLLEYSWIYFFAFASFFIERRQKSTEISILRYGALVTLIFFTFWKSYQCRYVLFAIPLLVIMAFELIFKIYEKISRIDRFVPRLFLKGTFLLLIIYSVGRTLFIDLALTFTNDMCYF